MKTSHRFLRPVLLLLLFLGFAGMAAALDVRYAGYGLGREGIEVTDFVRQRLARGQNRFFVSNQTFGSDPSPGKRKYFYVEYFYRGEYRKQQAPEGATFTFPADEPRRGGGFGDRRGDERDDRRGDYGRDRDGGGDRGGWDGNRGDRDRGGRYDDGGGRRGGDGVYEGRPAAQMRFVNRYGEAVRIYSLNDFGRWEWVASLPPGARISTPARRGQFFIVTDGSNQELRRARAGEGAGVLVIE